ncbi:MAG: substrate-binding domain-containing protein [Salinibacterium sp.]|nr:substrate-binding domain-containing protein [Salinibacterium sp.]
MIGFDNLDIGDYVTPRLTTIVQDVPQKAVVAAGMLLDIIQQAAHPNEEVVLPVPVVERASVARSP